MTTIYYNNSAFIIFGCFFIVLLFFLSLRLPSDNVRHEVQRCDHSKKKIAHTYLEIDITPDPLVLARIWYFPRLGFVGYAQTIPGVFTPGITLQRTSVSSVGYSYPYPDLLGVLYVIDVHTRTRNFWKFCTPEPQIPGVRVYHFYNVCEFCTPVPQYNTRNFCEFRNTSVPYPEFLYIL